MLGSGNLYAGSDLTLVDSIGLEPLDAAWLPGGELLTLRSERGAARLEHWDADHLLYNVQELPGRPLRVLAGAAGIVVVTEIEDVLHFHLYRPTDDGDGDGVPTAADGFPLDPAASLDSDGDGAPDAWNEGYDEADSTTGLTLDAFPFDSMCQLPEHGLPDDPTACDVAGRVPEYVPDRIEIDGDGVVYLLSRTNDRIFRWSAPEEGDLDPIPTADGIVQIAWSDSNARLYTAYASGQIRRIDPQDPRLAETRFAVTPQGNLGLQSVGPFVFAIDPSGSWNTHYTFSPEGTQISAVDWNEYSRELAWSPANGRMYYFRDGTSPNDLQWEEIDAAFGVIGSGADSPYHGDFAIRPPIRVSPDGAYVVLGSGDVYDAIDLQVVGTLGVPFDAGQWLADGSGSLVTLRADSGGGTRLEQWNSARQLENVQLFEGTPLRVLPYGARFVVVTRVDGRPAFFVYAPTDDGDGDGVPFADDAFPLDPAASLDADGDGAPDAWNPGHQAEDSTTGLVLDEFPEDSACQLAEHALPGDPTTCDVAGRMQAHYGWGDVDVDENGIVYLLNPMVRPDLPLVPPGRPGSEPDPDRTGRTPDGLLADPPAALRIPRRRYHRRDRRHRGAAFGDVLRGRDPRESRARGGRRIPAGAGRLRARPGLLQRGCGRDDGLEPSLCTGRAVWSGARPPNACTTPPARRRWDRSGSTRRPESSSPPPTPADTWRAWRPIRAACRPTAPASSSGPATFSMRPPSTSSARCPPR